MLFHVRYLNNQILIKCILFDKKAKKTLFITYKKNEFNLFLYYYFSQLWKFPCFTAGIPVLFILYYCQNFKLFILIFSSFKQINIIDKILQISN